MSLDPGSKQRRRPRPARARIGVVVSRYHEKITDTLLAGALRELARAGVAEVRIVPAPGVFEIPLLARALARRKDIDAVLCFGLVLRGETTHDHWVAHGAVSGLVQASLETGKPLALGILTCAKLSQARARAKPKGREVARAALDSLEALAALRNGSR
jgi:6,7-dimethyl-8-ribityllumazine synthase